MDIASEISMVAPAVRPDTRIRVFACGGAKMRSEWCKHGGVTDFSHPASECGVVIFSSPCAPWVPRSMADTLRKFFDRGGNEAAVFEYDPIRNNFVRRDAEWLLLREVGG